MLPTCSAQPWFQPQAVNKAHSMSCPAPICIRTATPTSTVLLNWLANVENSCASRFQLHHISKLPTISVSHTRSWTPRHHVREMLAQGAQTSQRLIQEIATGQKRSAIDFFPRPCVTTARKVHITKSASKASYYTSFLSLITTCSKKARNTLLKFHEVTQQQTNLMHATRQWKEPSTQT